MARVRSAAVPAAGTEASRLRHRAGKMPAILPAKTPALRMYLGHDRQLYHPLSNRECHSDSPVKRARVVTSVRVGTEESVPPKLWRSRSFGSCS